MSRALGPMRSPWVERRLALVAVVELLTLGGCNDYDMVPGPEGAGGPSHAPTPLEPGTNSEDANGDTFPEPCADLPGRPAAPATEPPTCTALPEVHWGLREELRLPDLGQPFDLASWPIAVRLPGDEASTILFQAGDAGGTPADVVGVDGASGLVTWRLVDVQHDVNGLAFALDREGFSAYLGIADLLDDRDRIFLSIADLRTGAWASSGYVSSFLNPTVRDLDHDGTPEFVTDGATLDVDASELSSFSGLYFASYALPVDLDGDTRVEILNTTGIWSSDGALIADWTGSDLPESHSRVHFPALVGAGGQPVVIAADGYGLLRAGADGVVEWYVPFYHERRDTYTGDPIAVGDATGDGVPDICAEMNNQLALVGLDGVVQWMRDRGGLQLSGGCSMADLDADGVYEVIDWGQGGLHIYDGRTGDRLAERTDIGTSFWQNAPIVADVDGDGSAEIVVTGQPNDGSTQDQAYVYVLGAEEGRWARTRPLWNQTAYDITAVADDGRTISFPFPAWQTYNAFRAQPAHDGDHPDLVVGATDACASECASGGVVRLAVRVSNLGSKEAAPGALVRLLSWTDAGGLREVASATLAEPIPSLTSAATVQLEVAYEDWGEQRVLQVDGDPLDECDRVNDRTETDIPDPCG